jgi:Holliday junction resolvase RusA-like endonuclease
MIQIVLAGDPVAKGRPRFSRKTGHTYTPERTATYEGKLAYAAQAAMARKPLLIKPLNVSIGVFVRIPASWSKKKLAAVRTGSIYPATKPDLDNTVKIVGDALNGVVFKDDSQIVILQAFKRYAEEPRLEILIKEIDSFWD